MSIFNKITKTFQWGDKTVIMETGEIARQASGAVLVNIDDTVVLATVVASKGAKPGQDFFPLTVDYIEKTYAAGKIPGSFFKREAKPSEHETLTSRLIDRPIRPLFPEGFFNEVHVVIHTVSLNPEVDAEIAALIATSAALAISGIPFNGPIGAARVGYINGEYVLNPGQTARKNSQMDLLVPATTRSIRMTTVVIRDFRVRGSKPAGAMCLSKSFAMEFGTNGARAAHALQLLHRILLSRRVISKPVLLAAVTAVVLSAAGAGYYYTHRAAPGAAVETP
eukprot:gene45762-57023_t